MQPSKLRLKNYFVEEVSFNLQNAQLKNAEENAELNATDLDIEVRLGESKDEKNKRFCQLSIKLKDVKAETYPYKFKAVMAGFFEIDSSCSEPEADLLITNTAPSMLYTAAREYLLLVTGRTRFYPVMLPTVLFVPKTKKTSSENKGLSNTKKTDGKIKKAVKDKA